MLFLANNISKMKRSTDLGSRIIEVHNSSSISTGGAGSGTSNLRRFIIENDLLEAIVALPQNMFYNTGISTYLWIVTNKKEDKRKGYIQLIDASELKASLRKNVGEKNCEITPKIRRQIIDLYLAYKDADPKYSMVFKNEEFGYYSATVNRPLRLKVEVTLDRIELLRNQLKDEGVVEVLNKYCEDQGDAISYDFNDFMEHITHISAECGVKLTAKRKKLIRDFFSAVDEKGSIVLDAKGQPELDKDLKDTEKIPLLYEGGINGYWENEIRPYLPDSWIDKESAVIGYELSFMKYFYKPLVVREPKDIIADIQNIEADTDGLLASIIEEC